MTHYTSESRRWRYCSFLDWLIQQISVDCLCNSYTVTTSL